MAANFLKVNYDKTDLLITRKPKTPVEGHRFRIAAVNMKFGPSPSTGIEVSTRIVPSHSILLSKRLLLPHYITSFLYTPYATIYPKELSHRLGDSLLLSHLEYCNSILSIQP